MFLLFISAAFVVVIDGTSKLAVRRFLPAGSPGRLLGITQLRHRTNFYQASSGRAALVLLWLAAFISAAWLRRGGVWLQSPLSMAGAGCALGGAAGNLADILHCKYVLDFIDLGWWPVFNLADVAIVFGLAFALCS